MKIWITVLVGENPTSGDIYTQADITLDDSGNRAEGKALAKFRQRFGSDPLSVSTTVVSDNYVAAAYADIN